MPRAAVEDSFGLRVKKLTIQRGWSIATLAKKMGETKATLYPLLRKPGWPNRGPDFYVRVARLLECTVADLLPAEVATDLFKGETGEEKIMEPRIPFGPEPARERWTQPISDRTIAIRALGRLEHYAQRIQQLSDEYTKLINAIGQMAADDVTEARRALMRKVDVNDKGDKV